MRTSGRGPVLRSQLLARGYSDDEIRRICGARRLVAVRRGAYVDPDDERLLRPEDRHGLAVRAAVEQVGPGAVVSHASAAVVHGVSLWNVPLDRVHVSRAGSSGGRRSRQLHLHVAPTPCGRRAAGWPAGRGPSWTRSPRWTADSAAHSA